MASQLTGGCACTATGASGGVQTGQRGCARRVDSGFLFPVRWAGSVGDGLMSVPPAQPPPATPSHPAGPPTGWHPTRPRPTPPPCGPRSSPAACATSCRPPPAWPRCRARATQEPLGSCAEPAALGPPPGAGQPGKQCCAGPPHPQRLPAAAECSVEASPSASAQQSQLAVRACLQPCTFPGHGFPC